mgnify:CR=1 FL=1|tara:strand:- start:2197 stop:3468 length:1272 start_codon:yes stop_codon:yes gene_type:complete
MSNAAIPTLTPTSNVSKSILPSTGASDDVVSSLPYAIYSTPAFVSGAVDQVSYTFKKLGGDVLDIELTAGNIYAAYEEAVLEYSYIINIHQAKNSLGDLLGNTTASFDQDGQILEGHSLSGSNIGLRYPHYTFEYSKRVGDGLITETGLGGDLSVYSASFTPTSTKQDYDLQTIISSSVAAGDLTLDTGDSVGNKKIQIRRVYYKTPRSMWRFFGYYGGLNVIGNMLSYGQYTDDSTFEVIPTWQNKLQAIMFEDSLKTRSSQYSYEIKNNKLRIMPTPEGSFPNKYWVEFTVKKDAWKEYSDRVHGAEGVNNMNTLPYENIPYANINAIGKQWIRRYALALSKETLGQIRGKFSTVPIPGESVTLNHAALLDQAKTEKEGLREELKKVLDELTYAKLAERDATTTENVTKALSKVPYPIYVG